jgi:hypothetical protein
MNKEKIDLKENSTLKQKKNNFQRLAFSPQPVKNRGKLKRKIEKKLFSGTPALLLRLIFCSCFTSRMLSCCEAKWTSSLKK